MNRFIINWTGFLNRNDQIPDENTIFLFQTNPIAAITFSYGKFQFSYHYSLLCRIKRRLLQ